MPLALRIAFLTPEAALIGLAALLPLAALALAEVRQRRLRRELRLRSPRLRSRLPAALAIASVLALLAAAAAQPVVRTSRELRLRTDAEVFVVLDNSRSMLARAAPSAPTRFERAQALAVRLRGALPQVPVGVTTLTDRPVVHLFPTADAGVFTATVRGAVGVDRPPPARGDSATATDLGTLGFLGTDNFFLPRSTRRLAVVLSDGESRPYDAAALEGALAQGAVSLVAVRFWSSGERIWDGQGRLEPYRPDSGATAQLDRLPRLVGGRPFAEADEAGILRAVRRALNDGPSVVAGREDTGARPLGTYVALVAALPLGLLLTRRR
jgi:hypothetical protein